MIILKILTDKNVSVAEFKKLSKYKDLEIRVEKLWHMKSLVIHVMIGGLDIIKNGTKKYLEQISRSPNLAEIENCTYRHCSHPP